ncbi:hypothetical protein CMU30_13885 [Elizabethkingia anophelis]|nr:hypothetical protein [Elizabethkingia anophelis]MDV3684369.1 hypothetical protein [Elizabethkingia anophelis]MDV3699712.1 hypothetical protein [Elizabethkingia anophelis]MDV3763635.1 hypothetical protein [Elizabethkingia anophelis]MDV3802630.1 hypothetical protein [Elizabethkingia anophelis]
MKTKYIIVNTEERLPTESDQYYTDQGKIDFSNKNGNFWDENDEFELYPNWWLEEKEDHSEEMLFVMKQMDDIINKLEWPYDMAEEISQLTSYYHELINKVKDNGNAKETDKKTT